MAGFRSHSKLKLKTICKNSRYVNKFYRNTKLYFIFRFADKPWNTSLLSSEKSSMITFDSSVTITCRTKSNPSPYRYTFYKDGVVVQKGNARSFNITQVSYRDQGTYTCAPENIPGRGSSAMLNLTVQGKTQQDLCLRHILRSY